MEVFVGIIIGAIGGWFARDAIPALQRNRQARPAPVGVATQAANEAPDEAAGAETASESEAPPVIHTVKADEGWEVRREGDDEVLASFDTKAEAQVEGRQIAKDEAAEYVVHRVDDSVSEHRDYTDPDPDPEPEPDPGASDSSGGDAEPRAGG